MRYILIYKLKYILLIDSQLPPSESVPKAKGDERNERIRRRSQGVSARGSVRAIGATRSSDNEGSSKVRGDKDCHQPHEPMAKSPADPPDKQIKGIKGGEGHRKSPLRGV